MFHARAWQRPRRQIWHGCGFLFVLSLCCGASSSALQRLRQERLDSHSAAQAVATACVGWHRYTKLADWSYIDKCAQLSSIPLIGNGDICSWQDYWHRIETTKVSAA
jgi:hypothetical protein